MNQSLLINSHQHAAFAGEFRSSKTSGTAFECEDLLARGDVPQFHRLSPGAGSGEAGAVVRKRDRMDPEQMSAELHDESAAGQFPELGIAIEAGGGQQPAVG